MALQPEILQFLKDALPFWKKLNEDQQKFLENMVSYRFYRKGEHLRGNSEDCTGLLLVKSGQVRAFILSDSGKEITLYHLFERDICIFSASCVMKNINFDIYADAEKDSGILIIPTSVYNQLYQNSLAVSDYANQLLSARFSDVMWIVEQVLFMSFDKRLALFLLEQSDIEDSNNLTLTHEVIAKNMGSAREVVTRMLNYFQSIGLISLHRGGLIIKDRKKLEEIAY
jgi:CRP/FNR family transcriptional regulator